jgi:hypothetical protein
MQEVIIAVGWGAASGLLAILTVRLRQAWLGWLMLAPLAAAAYLLSPIAAALAGFSRRAPKASRHSDRQVGSAAA